MTDRSFLDIMTNVFAVFILIILFFILIFREQHTMMVEGIIVPMERNLAQDYYYLELVEHFVIPLGLGGECDEKYYKSIKTDFGHICVAYADLFKKTPEKFNFYNKNSIYYKTLKELNPSTTYPVFLVRPSAFDYYHEVTKVAKENHFKVGWYPLKEEEPLAFSVYGRKIGPQD